MRIIILTMAIGIMFSTAVSGQSNSKFGVKAGVGLANYYGSMADQSENMTSFTLGIFSSYRLTGDIHFQPELLLVTKHSNGELTLDPDKYENLQIGYIEIPLLVKYIVKEGENMNAGLLAGPAFGFKIFDNHTKSEGHINLFDLESKNQVFSVVGGLFMEIDRFTVDLRLDLGLSDSFDRTNARNRAVSANVGYSF